MAKLSLLEKVQKINFKHFEFVGMRTTKGQDGKITAILELAEPIAQVKGSQRYEMGGNTGYYSATDVTEVRVHEDNFVDGFEFDEDGDGGEYKGEELQLDVAKRTGEVWLVKIPFAQAANTFRSANRNDRTASIIKAQLEREGKKIEDVTTKDGKLQPVDNG